MRVSQFMLVLMITIPECCDGLANDSSSWHPIPHCPSRREVILSTSTAATVASSLVGKTNCADAVDTYLSASSINSHLAIPVWPSWGGGRVIPISLEQDEDPFLLLAHHKHWFDPKDPLREPFKLGGKALGLPYIDVEGFSVRIAYSHRLSALVLFHCLPLILSSFSTYNRNDFWNWSLIRYIQRHFISRCTLIVV